MKRLNTHRSATTSGRRRLCHETLERRDLLAVVLGDVPAALVSGSSSPAFDPVSSGYVATCQASTGGWQDTPAIKLGPDGLMRITADLGKAERTPVTDIDVPETLDGPIGRNPGDFEAMPEEDMPWPLPEGIDPGKLGGPGCPLAPPSEGNRYWLGTDEEWAAQNEAWDVSCHPERLEFIDLDDSSLITGNLADATRNKIDSMGLISTDAPGQSCEKGSGDKDSGDKSTGGDVKEDDPVIDESAGKPSIEKDSEPEGDDPDELRGAFVDEAMTAYGSGGRAAAGLDSHGNPQRTTGERGEGLGWRVAHEARPGVEDGGPDELASPVLAEAIDCALTQGLNATPPPDDDGGGPYPGPEFNASQIRGQAFSTSASSDGQSAYPRPDDDGTGPVLPPTA